MAGGCPPAWIRPSRRTTAGRPRRPSPTPADPWHRCACRDGQAARSPSAGGRPHAEPDPPPYRDDRRAPGSPAARSMSPMSLAPSWPAGMAFMVQRCRTSRGLLCQDWRRIPLLLQEPSCITRHATPGHFTSNRHAPGPGSPAIPHQSRAARIPAPASRTVTTGSRIPTAARACPNHANSIKSMALRRKLSSVGWVKEARSTSSALVAV